MPLSAPSHCYLGVGSGQYGVPASRRFGTSVALRRCRMGLAVATGCCSSVLRKSGSGCPRSSCGGAPSRPLRDSAVPARPSSRRNCGAAGSAAAGCGGVRLSPADRAADARRRVPDARVATAAWSSQASSSNRRRSLRIGPPKSRNLHRNSARMSFAPGDDTVRDEGIRARSNDLARPRDHDLRLFTPPAGPGDGDFGAQSAARAPDRLVRAILF